MEIFNYLVFLLLLYAPTFIANSVPVVIKNVPWIKKYNTPIHESYFWKNKTWRWFISGVSFAIIISLLEFHFLKYFWENPILEQYYSVIHSTGLAVLAWLLQWVWALLWDMVESFIKRKTGRKPGAPWPFWDGVDYIIGSLILFSPIYVPSFWGIVFLILFSPCISLIANVTAYTFGWKDVWY